MRTIALAVSVGIFAAGCFGPPVSVDGMEDARITPAIPLRNADIQKPPFFESASVSLSAKPCDCPQGFIVLSTETVWTEGRPVDGFTFKVYQADAPDDAPFLPQEREALRLLPGRYDIRVSPNVHGSDFDQEIVVRGVQLLDSGLEYKLTLNLNGGLIRISGADWYRVHPGGTRRQAEESEDALRRIPNSLVYTQSSKQFEFPVPRGTYDIFIAREDSAPVWVENYRPQPGHVNVINFDDLVFSSEDGSDGEDSNQEVQSDGGEEDEEDDEDDEDAGREDGE